LVEIAPARHLITMRSGTPLETLELALVDLLETVPREDEGERRLLVELRGQLRRLRTAQRMSKAELLVVGSAPRRARRAARR
jgi:hypothetical protein